jgi:hypothetical protein
VHAVAPPRAVARAREPRRACGMSRTSRHNGTSRRLWRNRRRRLCLRRFVPIFYLERGGLASSLDP